MFPFRSQKAPIEAIHHGIRSRRCGRTMARPYGVAETTASGHGGTAGPRHQTTAVRSHHGATLRCGESLEVGIEKHIIKMMNLMKYGWVASGAIALAMAFVATSCEDDFGKGGTRDDGTIRFEVVDDDIFVIGDGSRADDATVTVVQSDPIRYFSEIVGQDTIPMSLTESHNSSSRLMGSDATEGKPDSRGTYYTTGAITKFRGVAYTDGGKLFTAFGRDLVDGPPRLPRPINAEFLDKTGKGARAFVIDEFRQRACRRGEGHCDDRPPQVVDFDAVDQTKVDDIDTQFGIDHLMQRLFDVLCRRTADIVHSDQRDVVIAGLATVMLTFLLAVLATRASIALG